MSSACRSLSLKRCDQRRLRLVGVADDADHLVDVQQHQLPAFEDVDAVAAPCRADARERRSTVRWRNAIHSASIWRRLFCVGRPSRPTIVRLIGAELSRLVCASSVVIELLLRRCVLRLGLEHEAHRRVLARLVAHRVEHREHASAFSCTCSGEQRLLAGLDLRVGELLDLLEHLLRADAPGGSSVTTSCHWPRARSSIFQRARTFSAAAAARVRRADVVGAADDLAAARDSPGPGTSASELVVGRAWRS